MMKAERWLAYFANQLDEQEAEEMDATAIKDAFNAADLFMQNEEQRLAYVNREMAIMDYQSDMNACREEGREEGEAAGAIYSNFPKYCLSPVACKTMEIQTCSI